MGAGQHREYFFNCYCPSKWKWGDFKLLLPKRCKIIVALGVWVGTRSGLCFLFLISLRLRTLVQWFSCSLFFKRNQAKKKTLHAKRVFFFLEICR